MNNGHKLAYRKGKYEHFHEIVLLCDFNIDLSLTTQFINKFIYSKLNYVVGDRKYKLKLFCSPTELQFSFRNHSKYVLFVLSVKIS